jgi:DNA-binding MarR family transcriptional regulator
MLTIMANSRNESVESLSLYDVIIDLMPAFVLNIDPIFHSARFRGERVTDYQIKVVMLLFHHGDAKPGFISRTMNIQKGSLTGVLKSLRSSGLVERLQIDGNDRSYFVSLTEKGKDFVEHHLLECQQDINRMFEDMKADEKRAVTTGLQILTRYLCKNGERDERP